MERLVGEIKTNSRNRFDPVGRTKGEATHNKRVRFTPRMQLHGKFGTGDHTIFVGEVIQAYASKNALGAKMIFHLGGNRFSSLARKVVEPER